MSPKSSKAKLKFRKQVSDKILEIKTYIDEQRGTESGDQVGLQRMLEVLEGINYIRTWPWVGNKIPDLGPNYRKKLIGRTYLLYYFVENPETLIYVFELRHASQKPLSPSTIRKYKRETEQQ